MQNTKRVFCHILLDCAVPRFNSKQPLMREKLIEMVLYHFTCLFFNHLIQFLNIDLEHEKYSKHALR